MAEPTIADFEEAARLYFSQLASEMDRPRGFSDDPDRLDRDIAYSLHLNEERTIELAEQLQRNQFDGQVLQHAIKMAALIGLKFEHLTVSQQTQLQRLAVRTDIAESELFAHQITSPLDPFEPGDPLFHTQLTQEPRGTWPSPPELRQGRTIKSAADEYVARKRAKKITENQIAELERVFGWLQEEAGQDALLGGVSKDMLRRFRDDLARRNVGLRGRRVPFRHGLAERPEDYIKFQTAIRYWNAVQRLFAWSFSEGLIDADPAAGIIMDPPKSVVVQSPNSFTTDELQRLLKTPLFSGFKSAKRVTEPGAWTLRDGHWWYLLLAMHSGARGGELCQLYPSDFVFDHPVPHWKFRLEGPSNEQTKTLKNPASVRDVPIHPRLLELGLREFVQDRAKRFPKDRLLREFRLGTAGRKSAGASRFWTDYLKKFGLHSAGRSQHVWRHTVTDCLRANGVTDEDSGAFLGHSSGTQTAKYGKAQPLERKLQTVMKLEYGFNVIDALGGTYAKSRHG
ncbi:hypothetical protein [Brevundimonas sp. DC300-4]|uniref:hypothetical protein n=1 Tax=Brevundimonas sp. DC300-4 TaxID=2804594 RepID=UPI003CF95806